MKTVIALIKNKNMSFVVFIEFEDLFFFQKYKLNANFSFFKDSIGDIERFNFGNSP